MVPAHRHADVVVLGDACVPTSATTRYDGDEHQYSKIYSGRGFRSQNTQRIRLLVRFSFTGPERP